MISDDEIISIYARQLMQTTGLNEQEAIAELREALFDNLASKRALLAITADVWQHGYESRTFRLLSVEQKCELANRNPTVPGVMNLIERIERAILENNHAK